MAMLEEQETTLTLNRADGYWMVYTSVQSDMRFYDKIVEENPDTCEVLRIRKIDGQVVTKQYKIWQDVIAVRRKFKRNLTDEQKAACSQRILEYHKQQKAQQDDTKQSTNL